MPEDLFAAAGTLEPAYRAMDWAATPLGPVDTWTPTLRSVVGLALHTRYPVSLLWGPEFVQLYNEAYVELIGDKHPQALGRPTQEMFKEAWDIVGPLMESVAAGEGATWVRDALVPLERNGFLEECYFTYSYSPVHAPDGSIEGVLDIASETTREVLTTRRLALLGRLRAQLAALEHPDDLGALVETFLGSGHPDLVRAAIRAPRSAGVVPPDDGLPAAPYADPGAIEEVLLEDGPRGKVAWLPLRAAGAAAGDPSLLVVELSSTLVPGEEYLTFLRLIATALTQTLDRLEALTAERRMAENDRRLSESMQRSLLSRPYDPQHLDIAVRYQPALDEARVGGDWYDSFVVPDGTLTLAIGDVAGHDEAAVAEMAQIRSLLRGIAFTRTEAPGRILTAVDEAMQGLGVESSATALLARVELVSYPDGREVRRLRWSSAGHLPPVLVTPDGRARLLESDPEPLLGVDPGYRRRDSYVLLEDGASVVFYTDGLVERRGVPIDESLLWLRAALSDTQGLDAEALCDHLLGQLTDGDEVEDDIALMVVRTEPVPAKPEPA